MIEVITKEINISENQDSGVAIALFSYLSNPSVYGFNFIADPLIANKEILASNQISESDEAFLADLFALHISQKKNQPIIRFGKGAVISD